MLLKTALALMLALSISIPAAAATDGPSCTHAYPRGFKLPKGTKKRPLVICKGDLQSTWGGCTSRFRA